MLKAPAGNPFFASTLSLLASFSQSPHFELPVFNGSLAHTKNDLVRLVHVTYSCVQSELWLSVNAVEPARPSRATWYVPANGTTIVMLNEDSAFLKKTSPVDASTPTA